MSMFELFYMFIIILNIIRFNLYKYYYLFYVRYSVTNNNLIDKFNFFISAVIEFC